MRYFNYRQISAILQIAGSTPYRWFPATRGGLVSEAEILARLNASRKNGQPPLAALPDQLYRPKELARWMSEHTPRRRTETAVREWVQDGAPAFVLGRCLLLDLDAVMAWLGQARKPLRRSALDSFGDK